MRGGPRLRPSRRHPIRCSRPSRICSATESTDVTAGGMNPMMRDAATETALADPHGYLTYYKLSDVPFRATADPRRLWLGGTQRALLETLTAAIRQGDGVLLLTGDTGTGQTQVVNWLIETLGGESLLIGRLPPCVFEVSE